MNRHGFVTSSAAFALGGLGHKSSAATEQPTPAFDFRSNFWINLHHTLYYQAQVLETAYQAGAEHLSAMDRGALEDLRRVAAAHEDDWYTALRTYHRQYAMQSFVFSDAMVKIDNALSLAQNAALPGNVGLPPSLAQTLQAAAPAYRASQWPRDDARNRAFIAELQRNLDRFGTDIARRLAQLYRTPWLRMPMRVDVMPYANFEGSYSNNAEAFVHIAMSTQDPVEHGLSGLDVLMHEASHSIADPAYGTIGGAIVAAAHRAKRPTPDQFWHAVIMYTPGKLAQDAFERAGLGPYTMFAWRAGLFTRDWPRYWDVLRKHWQPYMDGHGTLQSALADCIDSIVRV